MGLATDLQLASDLPDTDLVEYVNGSPYVDNVLTAPWTLDTDGMLAIPDGPGLGIELAPDRLARYADVDALLGAGR